MQEIKMYFILWWSRTKRRCSSLFCHKVAQGTRGFKGCYVQELGTHGFNNLFSNLQEEVALWIAGRKDHIHFKSLKLYCIAERKSFLCVTLLRLVLSPFLSPDSLKGTQVLMRKTQGTERNNEWQKRQKNNGTIRIELPQIEEKPQGLQSLTRAGPVHTQPLYKSTPFFVRAKHCILMYVTPQ